jgi:hypothetical protein
MVDRAHVSTTVYEALVSMWPGGFDREALTYNLSLRSDGLGLDAIEMVELHLREMLLNPAA